MLLSTDFLGDGLQGRALPSPLTLSPGERGIAPWPARLARVLKPGANISSSIDSTTPSKPPLQRERAGGRGARGPQFLAVICLFMSALSSHAGTPFKVPTDTSTDIQVQCWLQHCPPLGMVEVKIKALNHSKAAADWMTNSTDANFGSGSMAARIAFGAAAESGVEKALLLPLAPVLDMDQRYYKNLSLGFSGTGLNSIGAAFRLNTPTWSSSAASPRSSGSSTLPLRVPFFATSETFGQKFPGLPGMVEAGGARLCASTLGDAVNAPADWRGYSGLSQWWLTSPEWIAQSAEQRAATLDWVALGGRLVLFNETPRPVPAPFRAEQVKNDLLSHGLGEVRFINGADAVPKDGKDFIINSQNHTTERLLEQMQNNKWELPVLVGQVRLQSTLIFCFILIFALVVGPLNLFVFASGKNRPRLFWTTPLISLIGAGLLAALMIVQDGFGGTGARTTLAVLLPQDKKMAVIQEQVSRTGILLGSRFDKAEGIWMTPVPVSEDLQSIGPRRVQIRSAMGGPNRDRKHHESETEAWGGWFASRSTQAHLLQGVKLNRGGIEFTAGENPSIVSSLSTPLKTLYLKDDKDNYWLAEKVSTGVRTSLKKVAQKDFSDWKTKQFRKAASHFLYERATQFHNQANSNQWVFAEVAEPTKLATPTLDSIRWEHDRAFVIGPYTLGEGPRAEGQESNPSPSN